MWVRFNLILLFAVVACALGVVASQQRAREIYQAINEEENNIRRLSIEFGQLQIEHSTWSNPSRIEKIARDRLMMREAHEPRGRKK